MALCQFMNFGKYLVIGFYFVMPLLETELGNTSSKTSISAIICDFTGIPFVHLVFQNKSNFSAIFNTRKTEYVI